MDFEERIKRYIEDHDLLDREHLILGCSGGADSVALLLTLLKITEKKIFVVHVNHCLRGSDSDGDERFVRELCGSLNVSFKALPVDVTGKRAETGRSLEECARILRYEAIRGYARELFGDDYEERSCLLLAHHGNDVAETMLMNLFRGSGIDGFVSLKPRTGWIRRPFLCVRRRQIEDYLREISQDHREDHTNSEECCTRNIWRNRLIPQIAEASVKDPVTALMQTYELLSSDADYLNSSSGEVFAGEYEEKTGTLPLYIFGKYHPAISSRLIRILWLKRFGNLTDLEASNLNELKKLIDSSSGTVIDMPFSRKAYSFDGRFGFCEEGDIGHVFDICAGSKGVLICGGHMSLQDILKNGNTAKLPESDLKITVDMIESLDGLRYNTTSWFCPIGTDDKLPDLMFGAADQKLGFKRAGSAGTKELRRVLTDLKIPQSARERVFAVFNDEEILWIPGIGHSMGFTDGISRERYLDGIEGKNGPGRFLVVNVTEA